MEFLKTLPEAECVALYADFKKEVLTSSIFKALKKRGKTIVYPRIHREKKILEFFRIDDLKKLKKAGYAILEPHPLHKKIPPEAIQVIAVPGIAFDQRGYRLGYGKGYYDRVLKQMNAMKIGLAFDFQRVKRIRRDRWDQPVDLLMTEKRIVGFH